MKRIYLTLVLSLVPVLSCFAVGGVGDIVYDPTSDLKRALEHDEDIAKWIQSIDTLKQQLDTANQTLETANQTLQKAQRLVDVAGDPASALSSMGGLDQLKSILSQNEPALSATETASSADGTQALAYDGLGTFKALPTTLPSGETIERDPERYKRFAAFEAEFNNLDRTLTTVRAQREEVLAELESTASAQPTTEAEAMAQQTKLQTLHATLSTLDAQVADAEAQMKARKDLNDNQQQKEEQADADASEQLVDKAVNTPPSRQYDW